MKVRSIDAGLASRLLRSGLSDIPDVMDFQDWARDRQLNLWQLDMTTIRALVGAFHESRFLRARYAATLERARQLIGRAEQAEGDARRLRQQLGRAREAAAHASAALNGGMA